MGHPIVTNGDFLASHSLPKSFWDFLLYWLRFESSGFVYLFTISILCVFVLAHLFCSCVGFFCYVRFSFFSISQEIVLENLSFVNCYIKWLKP